MSKSRLPKLQVVSPADPSTRKSGRVTHDSRGTAVWDWAISTGVLARKTVDDLISTLNEPGSLALDREGERADEWSGDPYNRSATNPHSRSGR